MLIVRLRRHQGKNLFNIELALRLMWIYGLSKIQLDISPYGFNIFSDMDLSGNAETGRVPLHLVEIRLFIYNLALGIEFLYIPFIFNPFRRMRKRCVVIGDDLP